MTPTAPAFVVLVDLLETGAGGAEVEIFADRKPRAESGRATFSETGIGESTGALEGVVSDVVSDVVSGVVSGAV